MADPELGKVIKQTQDLLGKFVKKPPLSEKNLSRPPFRFLHDIVTSVINSTGFLGGVFTPEELDPNNVSTRESKTEFMKKLISSINESTGEDVPVKVSKILSGQEPEKTNILLQSLAKAIGKSGTEKPSKTGIAPKTKPIDQKAGAKPITEKKVKPEVKAASTKKVAEKPGKNTTTKVVENKPKKTEAGGSRSSGAEKKPSSESIGSRERKKSVTELPKAEKDFVDNKKKVEDPIKPANPGLLRQNSSLTKVKVVDDDEDNNFGKETKNLENVTEPSGTSEHEMHVIDSKLSNIKPNVETLPLPTSPIMSDASAVIFGSFENDENVHEDMSNFSPSDVFAAPLPSQDIGKEFENNGADGAVTQFRPRPGTGSNRLGTARPPSARPAPPRPKSSLFRDTEESNYRPPTGKVTHVLLDSSDMMDEDDNFVVREAAVAQSQGLGDLDETPELALTAGAKLDTAEMLDDLAPEQRGLLVDQILETQRELESKGDKSKENDFGVGKSKETSKAEVEKLKNLLQECARNANPLGKLLDYVREDIDAMQKEVTKWRDESKALDSELESAKRATEGSLQPLQQQFTDLEARIADKEDAIAATKMSNLRLQERIEKILNGLDRVQSSHGKIQIPSASELLQNDTSSRMRKNSFEQDNNGYSSGFGSAMNRLAKTTPGMRPVGVYTTPEEDLDPDNFDPFK